MGDDVTGYYYSKQRRRRSITILPERRLSYLLLRITAQENNFGAEVKSKWPSSPFGPHRTGTFFLSPDCSHANWCAFFFTDREIWDNFFFSKENWIKSNFFGEGTVKNFPWRQGISPIERWYPAQQQQQQQELSFYYNIYTQNNLLRRKYRLSLLGFMTERYKLTGQQTNDPQIENETMKPKKKRKKEKQIFFSIF